MLFQYNTSYGFDKTNNLKSATQLCVFDHIQPLSELFIKIHAAVIRLYIKQIQNIHKYLLLLFLICNHPDFLCRFLQKIMPVHNKLLISLQIRCVNPLPNFHLGAVFLFTFMYLKKIVKSSFRFPIHPSQRKQSSDSRADGMNSAAPFIA